MVLPMSLENGPPVHKTQASFLECCLIFQVQEEEGVWLCTCLQKKLLAASEPIQIPSSYM